MSSPRDAAASPPRLVFWESTGRCNLRCAHCRRLDAADPAGDLDTAAAEALVDAVADLGAEIFVISGGEPLLRDDWAALAGRARGRGLAVALATNGTLVDDALAERIAAVGFARVAVSLDAADPAVHDAFRGVAGAFDAAVAGIRRLRRRSVAVQVNAAVAAHNAGRLDDLYALAGALDAAALHLFVLVPVGCGMELDPAQHLDAGAIEVVLDWVVARQAGGPLELKATCAPQYHRVAAGWLARHGDAPGADRVRAATRGRGCLAGSGICFVSHAGEVFPCGYLPVSCGNVQQTALAEIWNGSDVLRRLRDLDQLGGACGRCQFKGVCGGCRARAYAATGDYLAEAPACAYRPRPR